MASPLDRLVRSRLDRSVSPPQNRSRSRSREFRAKTAEKARNSNREYSKGPPRRWRDHEISSAPDKELPYVFQQAEFIRIAVDLFRKCDAEPVLRSFLEDLDNGVAVDLSQYDDDRLRKKLRHMAKALYLQRQDSVYSKPPECKMSLASILDDKLAFIRRQVSLQGEYTKTRVASKPTPRTTEDAPESVPKRPLSEKEASSLLSLREMHEQGFFVDYENIQKEFMDRHAMLDVWGKSAQEQMALMNKSKAADEPAEHPWRVFDRDKDLITHGKMRADEYAKLKEASKNFKDSLDEGRTYSSFV